MATRTWRRARIAGGALAFLSKPVDDKLLLSAVESGLALDRERLAAQARAQGA